MPQHERVFRQVSQNERRYFLVTHYSRKVTAHFSNRQPEGAENMQ